MDETETKSAKDSAIRLYGKGILYIIVKRGVLSNGGWRKALLVVVLERQPVTVRRP